MLCRRSPGLFKNEFYATGHGSGQICLSSKTYCVYSPENSKISCKSAQKDKLPAEPHKLYKAVLDDKQSRSVINRGFVYKHGLMHSYSMTRASFGYFYVKRTINQDGKSTRSLDIVLTPIDGPEDEI